jgi:hypothetical protein
VSAEEVNKVNDHSIFSWNGSRQCQQKGVFFVFLCFLGFSLKICNQGIREIRVIRVQKMP